MHNRTNVSDNHSHRYEYRREVNDMNLKLRNPLLIDDYLDLLNLAIQLGDLRWQEEIKRKLHYMQAYCETTVG